MLVELIITISLLTSALVVFFIVAYKKMLRKNEELANAWANLEKLNEKYRCLFANCIVLQFDREGKITFFNNSAQEFFGYSENEIIGQNITDLLVPESQSVWRSIETFVNDIGKHPGEYRNNEFENICRNGERVWASWNHVAFSDENENVASVMAIGNDITKRKHAQDALRESEERFREIIQTANSIILQYDREGKITFFNDFAQEFFGYSENEIIGKSLTETISADTEINRRNLKSLFDNFEKYPEKCRNNENENFRRNGEHVWVSWTNKAIHDEYGNISEILSIGNDITKLKKVEAALRESEESLRAQYHSIPIPTLTWEKSFKDFVLLEINKSAEKCTSGESHKFVGKTAREIYPDRPDIIEDLQRCFSERNIIKREMLHTPRWSDKEKYYQFTYAFVPPYRVMMHIENIDTRKRTEEALRESEQKYRVLFEQAADSVVLVDAKTGEILDCNDKTYTNLGYTREEFKKFRLSDIEAFKTDTEINRYLEEIVKEGSCTFETKHITKKRVLRNILVSARVLTINGHDFILNIWSDITERKHMENALKENEERYRNFFDNAPIGFFRIRLSTGELLACNDFFARLFGFKNNKDCLAEFSIVRNFCEDKNDCDRMLAELQKKSEIRNHELNVRRKDGSTFWASFSAHIYPDKNYYAEGVVKDITDRKLAEEALIENQARYKSLFEDSPTPMWEEDISEAKKYLDRLRTLGVDDIRGFFKTHPEALGNCISKIRLVDVNQAAMDLYKTDDKGKLLSNLNDIFVEESYYTFIEQLLLLEKGNTKINLEITTKALNDTKVHQILRVAIPPGYEETLSKVFFSIMDITDLKKTEDELRRSREELRSLSAYLQSAREHERKSIAREIHDDLGQMLTALKMDLSFLKTSLIKGREISIEKINSMANLINISMQTIKRISTELRPGLLDDLGLTAAIEWQAEEFQNRTGKKCYINIEPEEIELDQKRSTAIFRIFQETLTNVARHAKATEIRINLQDKEGRIILTVNDNGKGISKDKIFHPKSFGLMGIRERVNYLNGELKIEGINDKGTTIMVSIPKDGNTSFW